MKAPNPTSRGADAPSLRAGMPWRRSTWQRQAFVLFGMFATAGMLIWGKLRLVGDIPRTAWAVPEPVHPSELPLPTPEASPGAEGVEGAPVSDLDEQSISPR